MFVRYYTVVSLIIQKKEHVIMIKRYKKLAMVLPFVSMLSLGAIAPIISFSKGTNGFSDQQTTLANHSSWMSQLSNNISLSELSIPGTQYSIK